MCPIEGRRASGNAPIVVGATDQLSEQIRPHLIHSVFSGRNQPVEPGFEFEVGHHVPDGVGDLQVQQSPVETEDERDVPVGVLHSGA